jgi:hypothetical protein
MSVRWSGKFEGGGLISFFLNGLFLGGKFMLLLKFFLFRCVCVFQTMFKVKVNLGFHKYADGGPIMDVRVR